MLQTYSRVLPNRGGVDVDFNGALDCYLLCYRHIVEYYFNGALDCYLIYYSYIVEYYQTEVWIFTLMVH